MVSVVLLSVLAITCSSVLARPSDTNSKTKRSAGEDSREVFKVSNITFPTDIKQGFTVTINGTMDTTNEMLEVLFPSSSQDEKDHCKIIFNFDTNTVDVSPAPIGEDNTFIYKIIGDWNKPGAYPTFSITLRAEESVFMLTFEANGSDQSEMVNCPITKFEDFKYIEFRNGVHSITSVLFTF